MHARRTLARLAGQRLNVAPRRWPVRQWL